MEKDRRPRLMSSRIDRLTWPGVGVFYLDAREREVVRVLLDAYFECDSPDVPERTLLRAIGGETSLAEVFAGNEAWGRLVVPGRDGTFRLAAPPDSVAAADRAH